MEEETLVRVEVVDFTVGVPPVTLGEEVLRRAERVHAFDLGQEIPGARTYVKAVAWLGAQKNKVLVLKLGCKGRATLVKTFASSRGFDCHLDRAI